MFLRDVVKDLDKAWHNGPKCKLLRLGLDYLICKGKRNKKAKIKKTPRDFRPQPLAHHPQHSIWLLILQQAFFSTRCFSGRLVGKCSVLWQGTYGLIAVLLQPAPVLEVFYLVESLPLGSSFDLVSTSFSSLASLSVVKVNLVPCQRGPLECSLKPTEKIQQTFW